jgi:protein phosphatase
MKYSAMTDPGKRKTSNDDMVYAGEPVPGKDQGVFLICKGAGPKGAGSFASVISCNSIAPRLIDWLRGEGENASYQPGECAIKASIHDTHAALRAQLKDKPELIGMGSVLAIAVVLGIREEGGERVAQTLVANIGDCRVYAIGKKMTKITEDHVLSPCMPSDSLPLEGIDPLRRVGVTRILGMDGNIEPTIHRVALRKHIRLFICSPGVSLHLKDEEILSIVVKEHDPESACRKVIKACIDMGGVDNVSAIVVQREDFAPPQ